MRGLWVVWSGWEPRNCFVFDSIELLTFTLNTPCCSGEKEIQSFWGFRICDLTLIIYFQWAQWEAEHTHPTHPHTKEWEKKIFMCYFAVNRWAFLHLSGLNIKYAQFTDPCIQKTHALYKAFDLCNNIHELLLSCHSIIEGNKFSILTWEVSEKWKVTNLFNGCVMFVFTIYEI